MCMHIVSVYAQAPTYVWAKTNPGTVESIQRATVVDASGNVYITGVFFGTVDFDPGPGVANITPSPYGCNIYLAKYDANGNYLWAKNIPIAASYGGNSMAIDGSNNIYLTGFFAGSNFDFDPGAGTVLLSSVSGSNDIYLAKYDCNGNYVWAKSIGSTGDDRGNEVVTDAAGNVFLTGDFSLTVDFDPGIGVTNLTSSGSNDVFIAKYNSNGAYLWAKQIGGASGDDVRDIAIDNSGNIFLTGNYAGTADFDPGNGVVNFTSAGGNDIFLAKFDATGNYIWANSYGSTGTDGGSAIKTDAAGNIFVTGIFAGTVDFNQNAGVANLTTASSALFFGKYDANGNFIWIKQLPINFYSMDLAIDAFGNIFVAGYYGNGYASPIDMDPGAGVANLSVPTNLPPPTYNILGKYDTNGNYLWAGVFGRQCYCSVMAYKSSLFIDAAGYLYYSGIFNGPFGMGTVDFDPGVGVANLTAPSSVDNAFFAKYFISGTPLPVTLLSFTAVSKNNINKLHWSTTGETNNDHFEIEKSTDAIEFKKAGAVKGSGNSTQILNYFFEDNFPQKGLNYYRLKQVDYNGNYNYSQVIVVRNIQVTKCYVYTDEITGNLLLSCNLPQNVKAEIINADGRVLKLINITANTENKIELQELKSGIYILRIISGDEIQNLKIIKK